MRQLVVTHIDVNDTSWAADDVLVIELPPYINVEGIVSDLGGASALRNFGDSYPVTALLECAEALAAIVRDADLGSANNDLIERGRRAIIAAGIPKPGQKVGE